MNDAEQFLTNVTEGAMEGFVLLWRLEGKRSEWWIPKLSHNPIIGDKERDLYVGVALSPLAYGAQQRCKADNVAGLLGLVADVDIDDPLHKKSGAPPNEEHAHRIIRAPGLTPTVVVHSGHGLQAWWLFREPWMFADDEERAQAQQLARAWGATVQEHARRLGFRVDSVHDLARVMRVPGTLNAKDPENVVPCRLLEENWSSRYNAPEDFERVLISGAEVAPVAQGGKIPALGLESPGSAVSVPPAAFPTAKHEALLENDDKYRSSWQHKRTDMTDETLSAYDLSLASLAARAGWSAGEIAALIRHHRIKYDDHEKGNRADYVQRTVNKAIEGVTSNAILVDESLSREVRIAALGEKLGMPLANIKRSTGQNQLFTFSFRDAPDADTEVAVAAMITQSKFASAVYGGSGHVPRTIKPKDSPTWTETAMLIYQLAEVIDTGSESSIQGETLGWIRSYIDEVGYTLIEGRTVSHLHHPFIADDRIWFRTEKVFAFLRQNGYLSQGRDPAFVRQRMKLVGAVGKTWGLKVDAVGKDGRASQRFWGVVLPGLIDVAE